MLIVHHSACTPNPVVREFCENGQAGTFTSASLAVCSPLF